jgi:hypothetical protein
MQARTSRIMRLPQPRDPDGRSCLPTHHPRSQLPWPHSPTPTPSTTAKPRTCLPAWPASLTRELPVAAATGWWPSWAWGPPRSWPRSIAAIPEWAAHAPQPVRAALGARRDGPDHYSVPAETTIRRTLGRLDADALASAIGAWLADQERQRERGRPAARRRAVAVDGKTLRGAKGATADGRPVHLLACMDHASRAVLAQRQVAGAPEELPAFAPLLDGLDLAGVVVTADALSRCRRNASYGEVAVMPRWWAIAAGGR